MLARLEIFHSRPIAPTRRIALGDADLPVAPPPGFGGILLGGIVAANAGSLDEELHLELSRLLLDVEDGRRIRQPQLRYRLQVDRVGLQRSTFALVGGGERVEFAFEQSCTPAQAVLGAVYAAREIDDDHRHVVVSTIRRATRWGGPVGPELIAGLGTVPGGPFSAGAFEDPVTWALEMLGFARPDGAAPGWTPERRDVLTRFRRRLSEAHPDHGGAEDDAARRIAELTEARRILLGR